MNRSLPLLWPPLEVLNREFSGHAADEEMAPVSDQGAAEPSTGLPPVAASVPDDVRAVLDRIASTRRHYRGRIPQTGDVVRVSLPCIDAGAEAVAAGFLLDREAEAKAGLWEGWMVSPEVDYAGPWDVLLDAHDGPADPLAGMVQCWHRIRVTLPETPQLLAQLSPERMLAIRAVATESLLQSTDRLGPPAAGRVGLRTTLDGHVVVTGQPEFGRHDPRHGYQTLYQRLAATPGWRDQPPHRPAGKPADERPGERPDDMPEGPEA